MELVKLRNGSKEAKPLVAAMQLSINSLWEEAPLAVYDLHRKCEDPNYEFFGTNEEVIKRFGLLEAGGTIHGSIRNIMLSMVEGEGMDMTLVSPVAV